MEQGDCTSQSIAICCEHIIRIYGRELAWKCEICMSLQYIIYRLSLRVCRCRRYLHILCTSPHPHRMSNRIHICTLYFVLEWAKKRCICIVYTSIVMKSIRSSCKPTPAICRRSHSNFVQFLVVANAKWSQISWYYCICAFSAVPSNILEMVLSWHGTGSYFSMARDLYSIFDARRALDVLIFIVVGNRIHRRKFRNTSI